MNARDSYSLTLDSAVERFRLTAAASEGFSIDRLTDRQAARIRLERKGKTLLLKRTVYHD
jgi:hypothetical protein